MSANEIKLFGKWVYEGVTVGDLSVEDFIALKPKDHVRRTAKDRALPPAARLHRLLPAAPPRRSLSRTRLAATRSSAFARRSARLLSALSTP